MCKVTDFPWNIQKKDVILQPKEYNMSSNQLSEIKIIKVSNRRQLRQFIDFYYDLYDGCPNATPYLFMDEMDTLRKDRNPSFECCESDYFLALRNGKVVGRVAAIINRRANERWQRKLVRFGWLDFIDDLNVSRALLDTVVGWGRERGMTELGGPLGFTDMDREGLLVEGFDRPSTMYVNYNYPYYQKHIEAYGGMEKDNDYLEYRVKVPAVTPPKFARLAEMVSQRYHLGVHHFTSHELLKEGKGEEIFRIINDTYKNLYGYSELSERQVDHLVDTYIRKADLNLVTAVYDHDAGDKMVGIGICFPSFSEAMHHTHRGRLLPFGWWHLLKVLRWHKTDTVDLLLIGVLPEYRQKGANAIIFNDLISRFRDYGFQWAEAMPQMEANTAVRSQWQYLESEQHRRHRCYTKHL